MQVIAYEVNSKIHTIKVENGRTVEQVAAAVPANTQYVVVDEATLPTDRYFRDALVINGSEVVVDMVKARDIQMDKIRELRDKKLEALDIEQLKGIDVLAQKQVLRDIPQTYDLSIANTPEELKDMIPAEVL